MNALSFVAGFVSDVAEISRLWWLISAGANVDGVATVAVMTTAAWIVSPVAAFCAGKFGVRLTARVCCASQFFVSLGICFAVRRRDADFRTVAALITAQETTFIAWGAALDAVRLRVPGATQSRGLSAFCVGQFLGYVLGGVVTEKLTFQTTTVTTATLCAVCFILQEIFFFRASLEPAARPPEPEPEPEPAVSEEKTIWRESLLVFVLATVPALDATLSFFFADTCRFSASQIGLIGAGASLVSAASAESAGRIGRTAVEIGIVASVSAYFFVAALVARWTATQNYVPDWLLALAAPVASTAALAAAQTVLAIRTAETNPSPFWYTTYSILPMTGRIFSAGVGLALVRGMRDDFEALPPVVEFAGIWTAVCSLALFI